MNTPMFKNLDLIVENAWEKALKKYGPRLCGFALFTDESMMSLAAAVNTIDHLDACCEEDPEDKESYQWCPAEWLTEEFGAEAFETINKYLLKLFYEDIAESEFIRNRDTFFEQCVSALEQLEIDKERLDPNFVLVFEVTDTEPNIDWIKRLNGEEKALEFGYWLNDEF